MPTSVECRTIWNRVFQYHEAYRWEDPHPGVVATLDYLKSHGCRTVVDLGAGYGRHALFLAQNGLAVTGVDVSSLCVERLAALSLQQRLNIKAVEHDMRTYPYPFPNKEIDVVVAIQSIHHDIFDGVKRTLNEVRRILRPGGVLVVSLPRSHQGIAMRFEEVTPKCLVPLDGPEKGIPHCYFDEADISSCFAEFRIDQQSVDDWNHWFIIARPVQQE